MTFTIPIKYFIFLPGADPGFLERGFICIIEVWGVRLADFFGVFLFLPLFACNFGVGKIGFVDVKRC